MPTRKILGHINDLTEHFGRIYFTLIYFIFIDIYDRIGEGNDTPLQYSCLENPRDGGAWWAAVSGVAQSRTRLKRRSSSSSSSMTGLGFPGGSAGKESSRNVGDLGSVPGLGRSPGEGNSYLVQYSGLENSMDSIVHGVAKCWT